jgi:hypothetical protein
MSLLLCVAKKYDVQVEGFWFDEQQLDGLEKMLGEINGLTFTVYRGDCNEIEIITANDGLEAIQKYIAELKEKDAEALHSCFPKQPEHEYFEGYSNGYVIAVLEQILADYDKRNPFIRLIWL